MHVLVACHAWYGDTIGGSFRLASEFAEYLASQGHRVSYVCCAKSSDWKGPLQENVRGVDVVRYSPNARQQSGLARLRFHLKETQKIVRRIHAAHPIQVVNGHSPLQALGAIKEMAQNKVTCNYTVHSPFDDELLSNSASSGSGLIRRIASFAARRVDAKNCAYANRVQCDSAYTLSVMQNRHRGAIGAKGIVAPGWVDANSFQPTANRDTTRSLLGERWQAEIPIFFTLRRLENRMGLETLVAASAQLRREGLKFRTLIGGGGSLQDTLKQQIVEENAVDNVFLLGRLAEEDLAKCYAAADCFVLPTRALECFGLIVLEAFACNTPVIASNVAAIPELAERQGKEWMFEPGNIDQLADRMRDIITRKLKPAVDLRAVALEYDKPRVLKRWEKLLLDPTIGATPLAEVNRR